MMQSPSYQLNRCRGFGLLIVLGVLIATMSTVGGLVVLAASSQRQSSQDDNAHLMHSAMTAVDQAIVNWLITRSGTIVLPHDTLQPMTSAIDDSVPISESLLHIKVTAWDQLGMVPLEHFRHANGLQLALPAGLRSKTKAIATNLSSPHGIDQLHGIGPMPDTEELSPAAWGENSVPPGALLSTHGEFPGAINLNTAPMPIIQRALRMSGRSGIEHIISARENGERVNLSEIQGRPSDRRRAPDLVSVSRLWSFRIDLTVNDQSSSWWAVYSIVNSKWRKVQFFAINN